MRALWELRHARRTRWGLGLGSAASCSSSPSWLSVIRDHFVAALARQAGFARSGRAAASPCPGAQGVRLGTAVHQPRAALSACARRRQRGRGADWCRASRSLRRCDADRGRAPLPRLSCRPAGDTRADFSAIARAARTRQSTSPGQPGGRGSIPSIRWPSTEPAIGTTVCLNCGQCRAASPNLALRRGRVGPGAGSPRQASPSLLTPPTPQTTGLPKPRPRTKECLPGASRDARADTAPACAVQ
jgi:hypothetical protein